MSIVVEDVLVTVVTVLVVTVKVRLVRVSVALVNSLNEFVVVVVKVKVVVGGRNSVLVLVVRDVVEVVVIVKRTSVLVVVVVVRIVKVILLVVVTVAEVVKVIIDAKVDVETVNEETIVRGERTQKRPCKLELQSIKVVTKAPASPLEAKTAGQPLTPGPRDNAGPLTKTPKGISWVGEYIASSTFNAFVTNAKCTEEVNSGGECNA